MKGSAAFLLTCTAIAMLAACSAPPRQTAENATPPVKELPNLGPFTADQAKDLIKDYRKWRPIYDIPRAMSASVAFLCNQPTTLRSPGANQPVATEGSLPPNPHAQYFAMVYVNSVGNPEKSMAWKQSPPSTGQVATITSGNPPLPFPVGTVIVKEKLSKPMCGNDSLNSSDITDIIRDQKPVLLTVMVKMKKGYNPEAGDWWFGTFDGDGNPTSGGINKDCMACHITQKENDYIYSGNDGPNSMYLTGKSKS